MSNPFEDDDDDGDQFQQVYSGIMTDIHFQQPAQPVQQQQQQQRMPPQHPQQWQASQHQTVYSLSTFILCGFVIVIF